jgi:hypothetical protein
MELHSPFSDLFGSLDTVFADQRQHWDTSGTGASINLRNSVAMCVDDKTTRSSFFTINAPWTSRRVLA